MKVKEFLSDSIEMSRDGLIRSLKRYPKKEIILKTTKKAAKVADDKEKFSWDKYKVKKSDSSDILALSALIKQDVGHQVAFAPDAAPAAVPVDAGYGIGSYGLQAYGEAAARIRKFISSMKGKVDSQALDKIISGYQMIFNTINTHSRLVLMGFQPSMREHFNFDPKDLAFALNEFTGYVFSIYIGPGYGMEPLDEIISWYRHIGVKEEIIKNIIFIEKCNRQKIPDSSMISLERSDKTADNAITKYSDLSDIFGKWDKVLLAGCADPYMLGEVMLSLGESEKSFEIDKRYVFAIT
jgi:hypothetical protein